MQLPFSKDSRERRRRQNRESQQRRRQRQKRSSGASTSDGPNVLTGRPLTIEEAVINTPLLSLPPTPPYPEYLQGSQALVGYPVQDPPAHWLDHHLESQGDSRSPWPLMSLDFPITHIEQAMHSKEDDQEGMMGSNTLQPGIGDTISPSLFPYQGPPSDPQSVSNMSVRTMFINQPQRSHSQVQLEQTAAEINSRRSHIDRPSASLREDVNNQNVKIKSPAEKAIKEVQVLYKLGVKVGFLKKNDRVRNYLATMKRKYRKMPSLRDEDCDSSSYTDRSNKGDSE